MEEKFECKYCGKSFDSSKALNQHMDATHTANFQSPKVVKKKFTAKSLIPYAIIIFAIGFGAYSLMWAFSVQNQEGLVGSTHIHTDLAVFLDGKEITPFGSQYFVRARDVHVEPGPGEGYVIHVHATGVTLGRFFKTLGMNLDDNCFVTDKKISYCNSEIGTLKMFVKHEGGNWTQNFDYNRYVFSDLDKILLSYGSESQAQLDVQMSKVTDFSRQNSGTE